MSLSRECTCKIGAQYFEIGHDVLFGKTAGRYRLLRRNTQICHRSPDEISRFIAQDDRLRRVSHPFLEAAERSSALRPAEAAPPLRPPFFDDEWFSGLPRPEPDLFPPPDSLFTVAHARRSASFAPTPRSS